MNGQYEGGTVEVPVTRACPDYDPATPGEYTFASTPEAPAGYALAEGLASPALTVTVAEAGRGDVSLLAEPTVVASGNLTDAITYTITEQQDADGVTYHALNLAGTGAMPNYTSSSNKSAP